MLLMADPRIKRLILWPFCCKNDVAAISAVFMASSKKMFCCLQRVMGNRRRSIFRAVGFFLQREDAKRNEEILDGHFML